MAIKTEEVRTVAKGDKPVSRLVPRKGDSEGICGMFPTFAGFWDDPNETAIDPGAVAALADNCV